MFGDPCLYHTLAREPQAPYAMQRAPLYSKPYASMLQRAGQLERQRSFGVDTQLSTEQLSALHFKLSISS